MSLLVFISHEDLCTEGEQTKKELLPHTQQLISKLVRTGVDVVAVSCDDSIDVEVLGKLGVRSLYVSSLFAKYIGVSLPTAKLISHVVDSVENVRAIFLPDTFFGKEVAGFLGAFYGLPAISDVESFEVSDDVITLHKQVLGGAWVSSVETSNMCVATLHPIKDEVDSNDYASDIQVNDFVVTLGVECDSVEVLNSELVTSNDVDLENAEIVVCGGRGTDGDFTPVYDLAKQINGVVGATRVATDEQWVDRSLQIGQTGHDLNAKLYIGLGVSGAVHHTCSLQNCDTIVAICDEDDAPIMDIADFAIVGDLHDVVPRLIEQLEQ